MNQSNLTTRALFFASLLLLAGSSISSKAHPGGNTYPTATQLLQGANLCFVENKGQVKDQNGAARTDVQFSLSAASGLSVFIGNGAIHYQFNKCDDPGTTGTVRKLALPGDEIRPASYTMYRLDVELVGANTNAVVTTEDQQDYYENHYTTAAGIDGVTAHSYKRIVYKNVYPNIDWVLYTNGQGMEHEFVVHEGGKASDIQLKYGGATNLSLDNNGKLIAETPQGIITENAPRCYAADNSIVPSHFTLNGNTLSYSVAAYTGTLVIDPTVVWATYYGAADEAFAISDDPIGNVFIEGMTGSPILIATVGAYMTTYGGGLGDAFLAKFDPTGALLWATYYGGPGTDQGNAVAADVFGNVFISGWTSSTSGIASVGAYCTVYGGGTDEAFLAKFNAAGALQWSTYFGGSGNNDGLGLATDLAGNVIMSGWTSSTTAIATVGAYQTIHGGGFADGFIAKFTGAGAISWATYYGGPSGDYAYGAATDASGNIYVGGNTGSTTAIATAGTYQPAYGGGGADAFLVKFNSAGALQWGTYFGGTVNDWANSCAVDPSGDVYLAGNTNSGTGIASVGAYQTVIGGGSGGGNYDGFLAKFTPTGAGLWATYFGGPGADLGAGVATDAASTVYLTGTAVSTTGIATVGAYQTTMAGVDDGYLAIFTPAGALTWATYYGGPGVDNSYGVATYGTGNIYIAGETQSTSGISTVGSYQPTYAAGTYDAFLVKFSNGTTSSSATVCVGSTITLPGTGGTWTSSNTSIATVGYTTGIVTGVMTGVATMTFVSGGTTTYTTVTVEPLPTPAFGTNPSPSPDLCIGGCTSIYIDPASIISTPGCTFLWTSSAPGIADVDPLTYTSSATTICGYSGGVAVISCAVTTPYGCTTVIMFTVTVHNPVTTITSVPPIIPGTTPPLVMECNGATLTASTIDATTGLSDPSTYGWAPPTGLSAITGPTVFATPAVTTLYMVTTTDSWGCIATNDIEVEPVNNKCVCSILPSVNPFAPALPGATGVITTSLAPGNYFMNNDVLIQAPGGGTITFNNCIIFIAGGAGSGYKMEVAPGTKLVLNNCHLFCCPPDMWQGIVLDAPAGGFGQSQIELNNNTLIEDAHVAIDVINPATPVGYAPTAVASGLMIINATNAIFNKNDIGIHVAKYTPFIAPVNTFPATYAYPVQLAPCYPFVVENSVFTSRNLYNYSTTSGATYMTPVGWPWNWPGTTGAFGLKAPMPPPTPYDAPYNIDNTTACPNGPYMPTTCNDGTDADKGIFLEGVGTSIPTFAIPASGYVTCSAPIYASIVTGVLPATPGNDELNMFDFLHYGIYGMNTNLSDRNSVYMHMYGSLNPANGGDGIFVQNASPGNPSNQYKLYVFGSNGGGAGFGGSVPSGTSFYDCINGVEAWEYFHVKAEFATVCSKHSTLGPVTNKGLNGFLAGSSNYYDVQFNHNNIYNVETGINYFVNSPTTALFMGEIEMQHNTISATNVAGPPTLFGEYMNQGISVNDANGPMAGGFCDGSQVNIEHNLLNYIYNGISVVGFETQQQPVYINQNNVILIVNPAAVAASSAIPQTGILMQDIDPGFAQHNVVTGPGAAAPPPPSYFPVVTASGASYSTYGGPLLEAYHISNLAGPYYNGGSPVLSTIGCNIATQINTGFYFNNSSGIQWIDNTMDNTTYGMVLNGIIGNQGSTTVFSNNQWTPGTTAYWTAPNFQTYTVGAGTNPAFSVLYVDGTSIMTDPSDNYGDAGVATYSSTPGAVVAPTAVAISSCPSIVASSIAYRHGDNPEDNNNKPAVTNEAAGQSYSLSPNPSDGRVMLKQTIVDAKPVSAEIWNAVGQKIYNGTINFDDGMTQFDMINKAQGLYLLNLIDSKGQRFTLKFTIK